MASSVKFGRFRADKAGYAALMDSGRVQGVLRPKAEAVKRAADGLVESSRRGDGYRLDAHEVKEFQGRLARGYVVRTKTDHARYAQAKRKTLTKALGSAKGGS